MMGHSCEKMNSFEDLWTIWWLRACPLLA